MHPDDNITTQPEFSSQQEPAVILVLMGQLLSCLLFAMLGGALFQLLAWGMGWETALAGGGLSPDATPNERWQMRLFLAIGHAATFVAAGWAVVRYFYPPTQRALAYLLADRLPDARVLIGGMVLLLVSVPLVLLVYSLNRELPIPDTFRLMEEQTNETLKALLQMDNGLELAANVALIALLPAVGEELIFRGVVQRQFMRWTTNPWTAIVLAAAVFSFIHFQFEGFFPRMLLGVLLGWLYWRTQNIWVPVAAHFANNAVQVVGQYLYHRDISTIDLEKDIEVPWSAAVVSLLLVVGLMYWIDRTIRSVARNSFE